LHYSTAGGKFLFESIDNYFDGIFSKFSGINILIAENIDIFNTSVSNTNKGNSITSKFNQNDKD
jgi:hypothetical protein